MFMTTRSTTRGGALSTRLFLPVIGLVVLMALAACSRQTPDSLSGTAATPGSTQDFVVNVGDRVFFAVNETTLSAEAQGVLSRQAQWLNQYPQYGIIIEGHADERGTRQYNLGLGGRRAEAVRTFLVAQGVAPNRVRTISYGKERPVAVCNDESCWSQNRRAVTVLGGAGS